MSKKVHYRIDNGGLLTDEIVLTIDSKCFTKTKYIDDSYVPSEVYRSNLIKTYELPYVLILSNSNVYPTTWKTFKAAREALKTGNFIVKRFKVSENAESYVFTTPETKLFDLKIPILKCEYRTWNTYRLFTIEPNDPFQLLANSSQYIPTIKAHRIDDIVELESTKWTKVGKPRELTSSELNNIMVARVIDGTSDYGDKLKLVRFLCKKGKPQSLALYNECGQYQHGTRVELSSIKVVTFKNGIGEYKYEIIATPEVKNSTPLKTEFEHICTFKKPIKGSTSHLIKVNITRNKFSDYVIGDEHYEFHNILDYVYIFKVPEYPKVLLVTKTFLIRATTWDTIDEAKKDLNKYNIYQHRVDAGDLGVTYVISPYDELSEFPYRIPTSEYIRAHQERIVTTSRNSFINTVKKTSPLNFSSVRKVANKIINSLDEDERDKLFNAINHGRNILKSEDELNMYLHSFGKMHEAKLNYAFTKMKKIFFIPRHKEIDIIDYGCGQGIASICFKDYLVSTGRELEVENITLIEPSRKALERASKLCSLFYPESNIIEINKDFDSLNLLDLRQNNRCTLHLLSNITDLDFDIYSLARKINRNLKGENWFVIVSPYFFNDLDDQMDELVDSLSADQYYFDDLDKDEFECYECTCRVSLLKCVKK